MKTICAALGLSMAVWSLGCVARVEMEIEIEMLDDEPIAEAAQAAKCNGCPYSAPVTTMNYAPPHAFPGPCFGPANPMQADHDGASAELVFQCAEYCGQSEPACGAYAHLEGLFCMDRDIGHRWGATCHCG